MAERRFLTDALLGDRLAATRHGMNRCGVDALLLSVGRDLPYLTGYDAMPLERLTMLVVRPVGTPRLIVPVLEAPRVVPRPSVFEIVPWSETEDPLELVAGACDGAVRIAIGDQTWARFLVDLLPRLPGTEWCRSVDVVGPLRIVKDAAEIAALSAAATAVDAIAADLQAGRIPLVGRTEAEVSADLSRRILAAGHERVNFAIVAAGANAASPHHHPGDRVIAEGEIVLCDFGGTMDGYCSDITRCVVTGDIPADIADAWAVLMAAQEAGVAAARVGSPCAEVDRAARSVIEAAGFGEFFVHRTGHGIGMEEHEDPYMVETDLRPLVAGHAFSVEPGIYVPGRWGMRLEDIVVATDDGPRRLNTADHGLFSVG
ncbi:MAG: hypothetical protein RIR49_1411 [Actinomycetota bacterium]|jgi:Xaa-Pro aminopeptidase